MAMGKKNAGRDKGHCQTNVRMKSEWMVHHGLDVTITEATPARCNIYVTLGEFSVETTENREGT